MRLAHVVAPSLVLLVAGVALAAEPPAEGVKVGEPAPDFTLKTDEGKAFTLSDERGEHAVLLAFYPKDFTGGCTQELKNLRDHHERFAEAGVRVLGLSVDDVESHQRFRKELKLPFNLLADPGGEVAERYDAVMTHEGKRYANREIVLVDRKGVVRYHDEQYRVGDEDDWSALLEAVEEL